MFDAWFWLWIGLTVTLCIAEVFTAGFFLLPFGLGAAGAAVANWLGAGESLQWIVFGGLGMLALAGFRMLGVRVAPPRPEGFAGDRLNGKRGFVTAAVRPLGQGGMVKVEREEWRAQSDDGAEIPKGAEVEVVRMEGARVIVRRIGGTS